MRTLTFFLAALCLCSVAHANILRQLINLLFRGAQSGIHNQQLPVRSLNMRSLSTASNKNSLQDSQEQQVLADQCRVLNFPAGDCEEESVDEQTLSLEYLKALEEDLQDAKSPQEFEVIRNRFLWNAPVRGGHSGVSRWGALGGHWWEGL